MSKSSSKSKTERKVKTETAERDNSSLVEKVKKKRNWVPNPQKDFGQENVEPGDNSRFLRQAMVAWDLPLIDISDPKQVENRLKEYFAFCIQEDKKPNMIGMANWLGVDRATVTSWKTGEYRSATHLPVIKKSISMLEELWVDYMQNGKINPASGIFLAKNMFGYRDVIDIAPTKAPPLGETLSEEELRARIVADVTPEDEE